MLAPELQSEIRDGMAGLKGNRARLIAQDLSQRLGVSVRQIYNLTADLRERRARKDAGARRLKVDEAVKKDLFALMRKVPKCSASRIIRMAAANGLIDPKAAPSGATVLRWMREEGIGRSHSSEDRVCRRWSAKAPNELHQADSTISATFYLDSDGAVGYESEKDANRNRKGNQRPRLILFTLVDDYSRATYAEYFLQDNASTWWAFLCHAWGTKEDPWAFPFEGLPDVLYADNGSQLRALRLRRAVKALEVEQKFHRPYHPQSKGKVERRIGTLQSEFECLFLLKKPETLDEANALLYRHLRLRNAEVHSQTKEAPFQRWMDRAAEVRRLPPEYVLKSLAAVRETRVLGPDLIFSLGGERFQAPYIEPFRSMPRGQKVSIQYSPDGPFEVLVAWGRSSYQAIHIPAGVDPGQVCALPAADAAKTRTNEALADVESVAAGLERLDPFAHEAAAATTPNYLPSLAREGEVPAIARVEELSDIDAMRALQRARICALPAEEIDTRLVASLMAGRERIPESEIAGVVKRFHGRSAREILACLSAETRNPKPEPRTAASAG